MGAETRIGLTTLLLAAVTINTFSAPLSVYDWESAPML
jgi:hypothetical protein